MTLLFHCLKYDNEINFILIPKTHNTTESSNYCTTAHISHTNKVILKILQAMNFQMFKLDSEKAEELEIKLPPSVGS